MTFNEAIQEAKRLAGKKGIENIQIMLHAGCSDEMCLHKPIGEVFAYDSGEVVPGSREKSLVFTLKLNHHFISGESLEKFIGDDFYLRYTQVERKTFVADYSEIPYTSLKNRKKLEMKEVIDDAK